MVDIASLQIVGTRIAWAYKQFIPFGELCLFAKFGA